MLLYPRQPVASLPSTGKVADPTGGGGSGSPSFAPVRPSFGGPAPAGILPAGPRMAEGLHCRGRSKPAQKCWLRRIVERVMTLAQCTGCAVPGLLPRPACASRAGPDARARGTLRPGISR
jgi:hypothetical protein